MNAIKYFMTTFYFLSIRRHFVRFQLAARAFFPFLLSFVRDFFELFSLHSLIVILFVFLPLFQSAHNSFIYPLKTRTDFICGQIRLTLLLSMSVAAVAVLIFSFFIWSCFVSLLIWNKREKAPYEFIYECAMYVFVANMTIDVAKQLTRAIHVIC